MMPRGLRARHVVFANASRWRPRRDFGSRAERQVHAAPRLSLEDGAFVRWLFEQAGLDFRHYRIETIQRRMGSCLRALRATSSTDARCLVQSNPSLVPTAVSALLIGVTSFFRDPAVFATIQDIVLPELTSGGRPLRAWSVGCSDGAELYSLAMLAAEKQLLPRSLLLGTDCRSDAIRRARAGVFDAAAMETVPDALRDRYFDRLDTGCSQIRPAARSVVGWRSGDVIRCPEPGTWDLILCRNLVIYLDPGVTRDLWEMLGACLRPGGILVVGKAERPTEAKGLVPMASCVYRRAWI